jgi:hypothetical protein
MTLKKWKCSNCGRIVVAFEDDIVAENIKTFAELLPGSVLIPPCSVCSFRVLYHHTPALLHGEAGLLCEGTVLDSIDSIHDQEDKEIQIAEDTRELKSFLDAAKSF